MINKIAISYPPLESEKGVALLSQNRQFQWFNNPTYIYPVVPAYAASRLKADGYDVMWDDGIAEEMTFDAWWDRIVREKPDLLAMEAKTPTIKRHWKIVAKLKEESGYDPIVVLYGDHVTAMPEESMESCPVDYVMTGGDYDFILGDLVAWLNHKNDQPPGGIRYRKDGEIITTGGMVLTHDLNEAPFIDRDLTKWELYAYKNGNFKYTPGTYLMAGRDCWWGKCTFCSWTTTYPGSTFRTVTPERHLDEIGHLIENYGMKEIFDDAGCFPKGEWLKEFCEGFIARGYHKKVVMGCNMRVGALDQEEWNLLAKANFRFILIGLESMTQSTLVRLKKGTNVDHIEETMRMAKKAGLEPHITTMIGYPWESKEDAEKTISFARRLFVDGLIDTLQATIVVPYPGTPMFEEARENGWLLTEDWDRYDMRESVWKSPVSNEDVMRYTQDLYKAALSPRFILRKIISIRKLDDLKFFIRAGMKLIGHLMDFRGKRHSTA